MKKAVQDLTEAEYLEEIREIRSNPPEVTYGESRQQYRESMGLTGPDPAPDKAAPSGSGPGKTAAA